MIDWVKHGLQSFELFWSKSVPPKEIQVMERKQLIHRHIKKKHYYIRLQQEPAANKQSSI